MKSDAAKNGKVGVFFKGGSIEDLNTIINDNPSVISDYSTAARHAVSIVAKKIKDGNNEK